MGKIVTGIIDSGGVTGESSWIAVGTGSIWYLGFDVNTTTGDIFAGGQYNSGGWYPFITKFDKDGTVLLNKYYTNNQSAAYNQNNYTCVWDINVGTSGNVYWAGAHYWTNAYYADYVKCDSNLNVSWARTPYGIPGNGQANFGVAFLPSADESIIYTSGRMGWYHELVGSYNSSGVIQGNTVSSKYGADTSSSNGTVWRTKFNPDRTAIYSTRSQRGYVFASKWTASGTTPNVWRQGNYNSLIAARDEQVGGFVVDETNNFLIYSATAYYGSGSGERNIMLVKKQASDGTQLAWKINTNIGGFVNKVFDMDMDSTGQIWACGTYGASGSSWYPFFAKVDSTTLAFTTTYRITPINSGYTVGQQNGCTRIRIYNNIVYITCMFDSSTALFKFPVNKVPLGTWTINGVTINISTQTPWGNSTNYGFTNYGVGTSSQVLYNNTFTSTPNSFSPTFANQILP